MHLLNHHCDIAAFRQQLRDAPHRILLLDYDGTLAPFQREPDQAFPYPEMVTVLRAMQMVGKTRIIIISGRSVNSLIPLLQLDPLPEIWGGHGWEHRLPDGTYHLLPVTATASWGLIQAERWLWQQGYFARCEVKPTSVAAHWRDMPPQEREVMQAQIQLGWEPLTKGTGLALMSFDGGMELRAVGRDKGTVVREIMATSANEPMAYLGDDVTDEDAFQALEERGLRGLVRLAYRTTQADIWLRPPEDVLTFLRWWC